MALAKERSIPHEPSMSIIMSSTSPTATLSPQMPTISSEEKVSFNGAPLRGANNQPAHQAQDAQSVISFSSSFLASNDQSLLSFEQKDQEYYANSDHQWNKNNHNHINPRFSSGFNCYQTASASASASDYRGGVMSRRSSKLGNNHHQYSGEDGSYSCGWLYSESTVTTDSFEESDAQESAGFNKRPHMGESTKAVKKQCTSNNATNKKPKVQKTSPSKDPQSIAAKNRRERISERFKILQELVPNGSKVDLVTMLEKAISYVKFLQLQVKVLATDEFWPVQGGKAPDISQVREAIDAILSSQRQKSTSTSQ